MVSDADLAADAARQAGRLLRQIRDLETTTTDVADLSSDQFLGSLLARLRPGDAILSEEQASTGDRLDADRVWIIDPLDGTKEYGQSGRTDWAVHVALWERGELVAGAVAIPELDEVWSSTPADSAHPVAADRPIRRIAVSRSRPPAWALEVARALEAEVVPMGSAGAKVAAVLRGEVDAYLHDGGQYEWDSAAPVVVARAHGYAATRVDGSTLRYNQPDPYLPDLVVCPAAALDEVLALAAAARTSSTAPDRTPAP